MPIADDTGFKSRIRSDAERAEYLQLANLSLLERVAKAEADATAAHELIETQRGLIAERDEIIAGMQKLIGVSADVGAEALKRKRSLANSVLAWLGFWSDQLPEGAINDLRGICGDQEVAP